MLHHSTMKRSYKRCLDGAMQLCHAITRQAGDVTTAGRHCATRQNRTNRELNTSLIMNKPSFLFFLSFSSLSRLAGQRRQSVCANSAVVSVLVSITRSQGWSDRMMPSYEETKLWDHRLWCKLCLAVGFAFAFSDRKPWHYNIRCGVDGICSTRTSCRFI